MTRSATTPTTIYEEIGGATPLRALVDRFYDLIETWSDVAELRALHPDDTAGSREKLYLFLSGWMGGPALYVERFGHPRLRARHLPFSIGETERDQWIACMDRAMADVGLDDALRIKLHHLFFGVADFMRNREG